MFKVLLTTLLLTVSWTVYADTLTGRVVKVVDGDTVTILDAGNTQHRIRLQGIDAPERGQAYGKKSGQYPIQKRSPANRSRSNTASEIDINAWWARYCSADKI